MIHPDFTKFFSDVSDYVLPEQTKIELQKYISILVDTVNNQVCKDMSPI